MAAVDVASQYFAAWNRRDGSAVAAMFAVGGTYEDPATGRPLEPPGIAEYARGLFEAFPDLHFEVVSMAASGPSSVAAEWVMHGTNSGPLAGNPPSGGTVALAGADFIRVEDERVGSVRGYFDQRALVQQLGLQVMALPPNRGPLTFGWASRVQPGRPTAPGAISLTWIDARSAAEDQDVLARAQPVVEQLAAHAGFLAFLGASIGHRHHTITAWERLEDVAQVQQSAAHQEAAHRFLAGDLGAATYSSVWVPAAPAGLRVRCAGCGRMADYALRDGRCACGRALPEPPLYW
jgi:steroid delta-isomerase-like uncharacterized protein